MHRPDVTLLGSCSPHWRRTSNERVVQSDDPQIVDQRWFVTEVTDHHNRLPRRAGTYWRNIDDNVNNIR